MDSMPSPVTTIVRSLRCWFLVISATVALCQSDVAGENANAVPGRGGSASDDIPGIEAADAAVAGPMGANEAPAEGEEAPRGPASSLALWPGLEWQTHRPEDVGMDSKKLEQAIAYAMTVTGDEASRSGIRTDGYVIIRKGFLVAEGYARGYTKDMRHLAWSATKSFVNALYGIAVREGLVEVEAPAARYYPPLDTETHRGITIDHLLKMSPGLSWFEGYEAAPYRSSVLAMLYTVGRGDMARYTATRPIAHPPGEYWQYSSGNSNLLMGILRAVLGEERYPDFPWAELFDKIGMHTAVWERDASGSFVGSSYLYATPRDLARFGYLYLHDGVWDGERILPEGWVDYTRELSPAFRTMPVTVEHPTHNPGAHWWLNVGVPERGFERPYPAAPEDCMAATGHWGQTIFVIPSLDLVIVRTADDRDDTFQRNTWLELVIAGIVE